MSVSSEQYDFIPKYFDGELSQAEKTAFEKEMNENSKLFQDVELYRQFLLLGESIERKVRDHAFTHANDVQMNNEEIAVIAEARKNWEKNSSGKTDLATVPMYALPEKDKTVGEIKRSKIGRWWSWLAAAASIVLISLIALWLRDQGDSESNNKIVGNTNKNKTTATERQKKESIKTGSNSTQTGDSVKNTQSQGKDITQADGKKAGQSIPAGAEQTSRQLAIFKEHFTPDSVPDAAQTVLEKGFAFYENEKYHQAIEAFRDIEIPETRGMPDEEENFTSYYLHYYTGISYMASGGNMSKALAELKKAVSVSPDDDSQNRANWYIALIYVRLGQNRNAKNLLKQIYDTDKTGIYKQKVSDLSKRLQYVEN